MSCSSGSESHSGSSCENGRGLRRPKRPQDSTVGEVPPRSPIAIGSSQPGCEKGSRPFAVRIEESSVAFQQERKSLVRSGFYQLVEKGIGLGIAGAGKSRHPGLDGLLGAPKSRAGRTWPSQAHPFVPRRLVAGVTVSPRATPAFV